jgi:tetratricopeptide (TPR) repeat protein
MPRQPLDRRTFTELVDLLVPFCDHPERRRALFLRAFGTHPILDKIVFEHDADTFVSNAIKKLHDYGEFEPDKTAVWVLLEEVHKRAGLDGQLRIDRLKAVVNTLGSSSPIPPSPAPKVVPPSAPPSSNGVDQLVGLSKRFEEAAVRRDWNSAIELGEKIRQLNQSNAGLQKNLANAYYRRAGTYKYDVHHDRAIVDHTHAIELDSSVATYYHERGQCYWWKKDYDLAIKDYKRAIQLDKNNPEYYYSLGVTHHEKGEYEQAIYFYDCAIRLNDRNPDYFTSKGISHHQREEYDLAINAYLRASYLAPGSAETYYLCGVSYHMKGNKVSARTNYQRAADKGDERAKEALKWL